MKFPNLSEKELVAVIISKNIKYYSITYIAANSLLKCQHPGPISDQVS